MTDHATSPTPQEQDAIQIDYAAEHVRHGASLRHALSLAGLPATKRMQLTRRLNELDVPYRWRGKGRHDDKLRLQALAIVGHPSYGALPGYWKRFSELVSGAEGKPVTAETIQLWYGRRFGPAYVKKRSAS